MTDLHEWARVWNVPPKCFQALLLVMGAAVASPPPAAGAQGSEAGVQAARQLRAARNGDWLLRNNSGALTDKSGRLVRYGLGNVSAQFNKVCKSSDLIGITRVIVTPGMVGSVLGVFTAEEVKAPSWVYLGDRQCICKPGGKLCDYCHQRAQMNFIMKVLSLGGIAKFVTREDQL